VFLETVVEGADVTEVDEAFASPGLAGFGEVEFGDRACRQVPAAAAAPAQLRSTGEAPLMRSRRILSHVLSRSAAARSASLGTPANFGSAVAGRGHAHRSDRRRNVRPPTSTL
jgi:hypothetical protein